MPFALATISVRWLVASFTRWRPVETWPSGSARVEQVYAGIEPLGFVVLYNL